jgi:sporulation protein YlmC with PRC-barrel domain
MRSAFCVYLRLYGREIYQRRGHWGGRVSNVKAFKMPEAQQQNTELIAETGQKRAPGSSFLYFAALTLQI